MNSPPPITSRANPHRNKSRRTRSRDDPTTPLIRSIGQTTTERRKKEEAEQQVQRLLVVSSRSCWVIYIILALLYAVVIGAVFLARRSDAFVPPLPDMAPGQTAQGQFNPHTAWEHLEAITTTPHPFSSKANTHVTKAYILAEFKRLVAEAVALGRNNVRYYDGVDDSTWMNRQKSRQQQQMEERGETVPIDGEKLQPEVLDLVQGDNLVMWVGGVAESTENGVPVKIEIGFDQESQVALLVSAHYDSVPTCYGKTDDGGGVSVALAMIRHFIHHSVQHTLIFNINNMEEIGLFGAETFMGPRPNSTTEVGTGHPWRKYVRAFVNLEGGGSGGPSLLFRATEHQIVRHYAENAPFPHAQVFANDIFQFNLINSDTDYSVYIQHGLQGLDIAFIQRRSMYHSTTDDLPVNSLFHMGSNAQATITSICNSDYLDSIHLTPKAGKQMVFMELWTWLLVNALFIGVGLPVLGWTVIQVAQAIGRCSENNRHPRSNDQNQIHSLRNVLDSSSQSITGYSDDGYSTTSPRYGTSRQHGRYADSVDNLVLTHPKHATVVRTTALVALIVMFDLLAVFSASQWQVYINPLVRHSHPWLVLFGLAGVLLIVQTLAVYIFTSIEASMYGPVPIVHGATQWTLAVGVWWWTVVLVIGTGVAGWFGAGALYGTTVLAACAGIAALLQILFNSANTEEGIDGSRYFWVVVLMVGLLFPGITILDLIVCVVHMTAQSMIKGDVGIMYIIYGVLLIPVMLPTVPVISRGRNFKAALAKELLLMIPIVWILSVMEPFTANDPGSIYFFQYYNQTAGTSFIELSTDAGVGYLRRMVQTVPTLESGDTCIPTLMVNSAYSEMCHYQPARQIFEDDGKPQPVQVDWVSPPKRNAEGWREGRLRISALDSRACTIDLAETAPGYETQMWMDQGKSQFDDGERLGRELNHRAKTLRAFVRDWDRAWHVTVRVKDPQLDLNSDTAMQQEHVALKVTCVYNDWSEEQGYASAYNELRTHIPQWTRTKPYLRDLFHVGVEITM